MSLVTRALVSSRMGEKQLEVDKRILRQRMSALRNELDEVRGHCRRMHVLFCSDEPDAGRGDVDGAAALHASAPDLARALVRQVKQHRRQYRARRAEAPVPVVAIVGYTNAGKSTLLNRLVAPETVVAEDKLFATLDPTTRRVMLPSGLEVLRICALFLYRIASCTSDEIRFCNVSHAAGPVYGHRGLHPEAPNKPSGCLPSNAGRDQ